MPLARDITFKLFCVNFLCHIESRPCFGPACVKCGVGKDLSHFLGCNAVLFRIFQMIAERTVRKSLGHKGHNGHNAAVTERKLLLTAPYLSEKPIIVKLLGLFAVRGLFPQSNTSSLSSANLGANSPSAFLPAVCFTIIITSC